MQRTADPATDHLTIGQFAKRGGVNLETIRYDERRGILALPQAQLTRGSGATPSAGFADDFQAARELSLRGTIVLPTGAAIVLGVRLAFGVLAFRFIRRLVRR